MWIGLVWVERRWYSPTICVPFLPSNNVEVEIPVGRGRETVGQRSPSTHVRVVLKNGLLCRWVYSHSSWARIHRWNAEAIVLFWREIFVFRESLVCVVPILKALLLNFQSDVWESVRSDCPNGRLVRLALSRSYSLWSLTHYIFKA